jgi:hypothetical protein
MQTLSRLVELHLDTLLLTTCDQPGVELWESLSQEEQDTWHKRGDLWWDNLSDEGKIWWNLNPDIDYNSK